MKKFISMVMAAAMVVSLVPATAFAADATATAKVVKAANVTKAEAADLDGTPTFVGGGGAVPKAKVPELQLKVNSTDYTAAEATAAEYKITLTLDNAEWVMNDGTAVRKNDEYKLKSGVKVTDEDGRDTNAEIKSVTGKDKDEIEIKIKGAVKKDDIITVPLYSKLTKASVSTKATVSVDADDLGVSVDDLVFVTVKDFGITASVKKVAQVGAEEKTKLEKDLKIESSVSDFVQNQVFELRLSSGFEFGTLATNGTGWQLVDANGSAATATAFKGETKAYIKATAVKPGDTITVDANAIEIVVDSAKEGAECKLTVKAVKVGGTGFTDAAEAVVVAKVVGETITLSVDEDEDVPVIYSGVNVANYGITDDSDHESLEVTVKESVPGALDVKKAITFELPEGVYATNVEVTKADNALTSLPSTEVKADDFKAAYKKGNHEGFEFAKRTFVATDDAGINKEMELSFKLTLIAEPDFTGDVTLKMVSDGLEDDLEVVIAKFVAPYTVEAQANDLIIDYRNTAVPTSVVIKEAEAGLWAKDKMTFNFAFDKEVIELEDDATFTVNDKSGMELKSAKDMKFTVKEESADEAAVVTISDISLYMGRNIAAGAYDLKLNTTAGQTMLTKEALFTTDTTGKENVDGNAGNDITVADVIELTYKNGWTNKFYTVKEGFVNVITAGRDQDDASFTKKVVVPVGEKYIVAGEETVTLDVPAYVSAAGYTMLPVRAVAVALGINNNNVLWDQATKTVTILYGQRIITMVAGQKVVYVNGSAIPASASVEIKDGRTFLPMRDLATALGVTDITWDAATKTATLNGNK